MEMFAKNRSMLLLNFLNRKITDEFRPLFEIIFAFETCFILLFPFVCIPIIHAVWRTTSYHRNIRLHALMSSMFALIYTFTRLFILCHQYFGNGDDYMVMCSLIREGFIGYAVTFASVKAVDRWIAMKAWSWYESGTFSTFLLFCLEETILISIGCSLSFSIVYGYIPLVPKSFIIGGLSLIGPLLFTVVLRANLQTIEILKKSNHFYSVARSFQLQENVAILTLLKNAGIPLLICIAPAFLFFSIYAFVPSNCGYDTIRFISVALYDLWLAITSVILVLCLPYYEPKFVNNLSCTLIRRTMRGNAVGDAPRSTDAQQVTTAYFDLLARHWENPV